MNFLEPSLAHLSLNCWPRVRKPARRLRRNSLATLIYNSAASLPRRRTWLTTLGFCARRCHPEPLHRVHSPPRPAHPVTARHGPSLPSLPSPGGVRLGSCPYRPVLCRRRPLSVSRAPCCVNDSNPLAALSVGTTSEPGGTVSVDRRRCRVGTDGTGRLLSLKSRSRHAYVTLSSLSQSPSQSLSKSHRK